MSWTEQPDLNQTLQRNIELDNPTLVELATSLNVVQSCYFSCCATAIAADATIVTSASIASVSVAAADCKSTLPTLN